jgi:hypothetical protein
MDGLDFTIMRFSTSHYYTRNHYSDAEKPDEQCPVIELDDVVDLVTTAIGFRY